MNLPDILNSKSLKAFIKGSLVLIGLFFILSCGVAVLLFSFDKKIEIKKNVEISKNIDLEKSIEVNKNLEIGKNNENNVCALIKVLTIPLIVFLIFLLIIYFSFYCMVKLYYRSPCNKYEEILSLIKEIVEILCEMQNRKENFFKTQNDEENHLKMEKIRIIGEACLTIAKSIKPDSGKNEEALNKLKEMLDQFSKLFSEEKGNS